MFKVVGLAILAERTTFNAGVKRAYIPSSFQKSSSHHCYQHSLYISTGVFPKNTLLSTSFSNIAIRNIDTLSTGRVASKPKDCQKFGLLKVLLTFTIGSSIGALICKKFFTFLEDYTILVRDEEDDEDDDD